MIFDILFMLLAFLENGQLENSDFIVQTENGPVRGKSVASGKVEAYLGIPYAEPPVGLLRFNKPVRKGSWNDVYDAAELPPPCIQINYGMNLFGENLDNMSEDCLYLSIWTPQPKHTDQLKAVMLFIHGGAFMVGTSNVPLLDGAKLSEHGDVVVVTINYRVGALGFWTGFTDDTPGSQGLYDQVMAMQWVKDNVKHFGGDPDNVVIFGASAGAFSVSMHQISPLSQNLFKRVILQGGSSVTPFYSDGNEMVRKLSQKYVDLLECEKDGVTLKSNPKDVVDCLKSLPASKFSEADKEVFKGSKLLYPRIGNDFLPENTIDLFRKGHFKDSEVMLGIAKDEGSVFVAVEISDVLKMFSGEYGLQNFNETAAHEAMTLALGRFFPLKEDEIFQSYLSHVNEETGYTYFKAAADANGDNIITCAKIFQAEYHSMRGNPVFFYVFDHKSAVIPVPEEIGVPHGSDAQYVFGNPMFGQFTEYEYELSKDVMDMWVTFAKTGNPSIPGGVSWPKYTFDDPKYLIIGKNDSVGIRPDNYRCERWRNRFRSAIDDEVIQSLKKH